MQSWFLTCLPIASAWQKKNSHKEKESTPSASLALDYWQEWGSFCWCLPSSPVSTWTCRQAYPGRRLRVGLYDVCRNLPVVGDASFLPDASFPDCRGKKKKRRLHRSGICKCSFSRWESMSDFVFSGFFISFPSNSRFFQSRTFSFIKKGRA